MTGKRSRFRERVPNQWEQDIVNGGDEGRKLDFVAINKGTEHHYRTHNNRRTYCIYRIAWEGAFWENNQPSFFFSQDIAIRVKGYLSGKSYLDNLNRDFLNVISGYSVQSIITCTIDKDCIFHVARLIIHWFLETYFIFSSLTVY